MNEIAQRTECLNCILEDRLLYPESSYDLMAFLSPARWILIHCFNFSVVLNVGLYHSKFKRTRSTDMLFLRPVAGYNRIDKKRKQDGPVRRELNAISLTEEIKQ